LQAPSKSKQNEYREEGQDAVQVLIGYWLEKMAHTALSRACLSWLILLRHVRAQWIRFPSARTALSGHLGSYVSAMLSLCLNHLDMDVEPESTALVAVQHLDDTLNLLPKLCAQVVLDTMHVLPTLARLWWSSDLQRADKEGVTRFVEKCVAPRILLSDLALLELGRSQIDKAELTVTGSKVTRIVTVSCVRDDTRLEINIRIAPDSPLSLPHVEFANKVLFSSFH